ncbi:MAG: hypothetical protein GEU95_21055 [Rhizobiales bacterium]|nr:hypothetical protein [Hyphomicrobiales bacterium]
MHGKRIRLSPPRRLITDIMRLAASVPSVPVERLMDLGAVIAARRDLSNRPPWVGIFAKAMALTAQELPELRRTFLKWPWPHLYEYEDSVAAITIDREYQGEPCVAIRIIKDIASLPLTVIAGMIHESKELPIEQLSDFKRTMTICRLPGIIRRPAIWLAYNLPRQRANYFGTFSVTAVSFLGADALHLPNPTTSLLTFGVFRADGRVPVRITMDHRVFDGMGIAKIMARLEAVLNGPILQELRSRATAAGHAGRSDSRDESDACVTSSSGTPGAS